MPSSEPKKPALSSNKINYLIWRYLQESGFSKAAVELQRAWNPDPHNTLPFAPRVQKQWLTGILALGLEYDELHERVSQGKIAKRFDLSGDDGVQYSRRDGGLDEDEVPFEPIGLPYGTDLHPPVGIYGARETNGRTPTIVETDTAAPSEPATVSKPKSKSRGRKGTVTKEQRPLDLMDIDTNGAVHHPSPAVVDGNGSDAASPAVEEPEPVPQTTAEIGDEKATESTVREPTALQADTFEVTPSISPTAGLTTSIDHADFAPGSTEYASSTLLVAGQNLSRLYITPSSSGIGSDLPLGSTINLDPTESLPLAAFNVLAFTWTPGSDVAAMAIWKTFDDDGVRLSKGSIMRVYSQDNVLKVRRLFGPEVRDVVALKWERNSKTLLCLSITGGSSTFRLWHASESDPEDLVPFAVLKETGKRLYDAAWVSSESFIVCGENLVALYHISNDEVKLLSVSPMPEHDWHRIMYTPEREQAILLSQDANCIAIINKQLDTCRTYDLPGVPTDLDIDCRSSEAAIACETGEVALLTLTGDHTLQDLRLSLGMQKSASACAWNPNGSLLAAAGDGRVVIWRVEDVESARSLGAGQEQTKKANMVLPYAVWMAQEATFGKAKALLNGASTNGDRITNGVQRGLATMHIDGMEDVHINGNGHLHSDDAQSQVSGASEVELPPQKLVWHADGQTLIYTTGSQVAVISVPFER